MITYPYQRAGNPRSVIIGYSPLYTPTEAQIISDFECEYIRDTGVNVSNFTVTGDQDIAYYAFGEYFEGFGRFFQFLDADGDVIVNNSGVSNFQVTATTTTPTVTITHTPEIDADKLSSVVTVRFRKPRAKCITITPSNIIAVEFQSLFTDSVIPLNRNDGYGYPYVLLPITGGASTRFPIFNYWSDYYSNTSTRYPLYDLTSVPTPIPVYSAVFVKDEDYLHDGSRYQLIKRRGWNDTEQPAHLASVNLYVYDTEAKERSL